MSKESKMGQLTRRRKEAHTQLLATGSKVYESFLAMEKAAFTAGALRKKGERPLP